MQVRSKGARLACFAATLASAVLLAGACSDATPTAADVDASFAKGGNSMNPGKMGDAMVWTTNLKPMNAHATKRAVTGKATFIVKDGMFTAIVDAKGVAPGVPHPQHIHGFTSGKEAVCPGPQADDDRDGLVELLEGLPFYGPVLVPLDKDLENTAQQIPLFPTPEDYDYHYEQTIPLSELYDYEGFSPGMDINLAIRAVVVHGAFVNGQYQAVLPVACGDLKRVQ